MGAKAIRTSEWGRREEPDELEIDVLLRLLREYSDRLRARVDKFERSHQIRSISFYSTILISLPLYLGFVFSISSSSSSSSDLYIRMMVLIVLLFSMLTSFGLAVWTRGRRKLLKEDIKAETGKLEEVIRLTSQIEEHVERGRVRRLELDLALTDAEGAVNQARAEIERTRFPLWPFS